jgi:hypothetical protein
MSPLKIRGAQFRALNGKYFEYGNFQKYLRIYYYLYNSK